MEVSRKRDEIINGNSAIDYTENIALEKTCSSFITAVHFLPFMFLPLSFLLSLLRLPSVSAVLLKFRTDKGRDPDPQSFAEDSQLLKQIRDDVLEALAVSSDLLSDDFTRYKASSPVMGLILQIRY